MPELAKSSPARSRSQILSTILFVAALAFAAAAVYIWYIDDRDTSNEAPVPTVANGVYALVNVLEALKAAGISADYGRSPAAVDANQIDQPGQNLRVGDTNVYIFFYPGTDAEAAAAAREQAFAAIDPATLELSTTSGDDPADGQPLSVYQGANVIAVLVGGDAELQAQVQDVIEGLQ